MFGYPLNDESGAASGGWRFNNFENGSIYWTPKEGAQSVLPKLNGRQTEPITDLPGGYHLVSLESAVRLISDLGDQITIEFPSAIGSLTLEQRNRLIEKTKQDFVKLFNLARQQIASGQFDAAKISAAGAGIVWNGVMTAIPVIGGAEVLTQQLFGAGLSDLARETGEYYGAIVNDVIAILRRQSKENAATIAGTVGLLYLTAVFPGAGIVRFWGEDGWSFTKDLAKAAGEELDQALDDIGFGPVLDVVGDVADAVGDFVENIAGDVVKLFG